MTTPPSPRLPRKPARAADPARLVNKRKIPRQATSRVAFEELDIPEDDPLLDFLPYCHKAPRGNSITPAVQRATSRK